MWLLVFVCNINVIVYIGKVPGTCVGYAINRSRKVLNINYVLYIHRLLIPYKLYGVSFPRPREATAHKKTKKNKKYRQ